MKIWKYLPSDNIFLNVPLSSKDGVFRFLADICMERKIIEDADALYEGLKMRESTMSTGIGGGIGLPHTTNNEIDDAMVFLIRLATPIEFQSLDRAPVDIVISIIIPQHETTLHLRILAGISRLCKNPDILESIRHAMDPEALLVDIKSLENQMAFH